jgi:hypothetical protein
MFLRLVAIAGRVLSEASREDKDRLGILWLSKIVGEDEVTIQAFLNGDQEADRKIGMKHSGAVPYDPSPEEFWREVAALFPGFFAADDVVWIIQNKPVMWAQHFVIEVEIGDYEIAGLARKERFQRWLDESEAAGHDMDKAELDRDLKTLTPSMASPVLEKIHLNSFAFK